MSKATRTWAIVKIILVVIYKLLGSIPGISSLKVPTIGKTSKPWTNRNGRF